MSEQEEYNKTMIALYDMKSLDLKYKHYAHSLLMTLDKLNLI